MKSVKKMILVPEDVFNRFEQKQKLETSPIVSNMMQKDADMSKLLYREDLNDDEKKKLYHANLERYLDLKVENKELTLPEEKRNFQIRLLWKVFLKQCVQEPLHF